MTGKKRDRLAQFRVILGRTKDRKVFGHFERFPFLRRLPSGLCGWCGVESM
jgi:hypothetical protein